VFLTVIIAQWNQFRNYASKMRGAGMLALFPVYSTFSPQCRHAQPMKAGPEYRVMVFLVYSTLDCSFYKQDVAR
jgi:hypothetical protein